MSRFSFLALLLAAPIVHATSVVPPTFSELVGEADAIVRASVASIESRWVDVGSERVIKTFVQFTVEKRLKGNSADVLTLEFLGGTVGTETLKVSGMPEFKLGEREIVFVRGNGLQFCPLVRFGHGRYHVRQDAGRKFVTRNDDTPLESVSDVQLPSDDHGIIKAFRSSAKALTPDEFETKISAEIASRAP